MFAIFSGAILLFAQSPARGQDGPEIFTPDQFGEDVPRGETVRSRQRPEVDPIPIHAGGFLISPSLRQGFEYNDNVFATDNNTKGDFIYTISPSLNIKSDWNTHSLYLLLGSNIGFYLDESDENYQDYHGRVGGTVEITSQNAIRAQLGASREHESRDNPDDVGGVEPTIFSSFDGGLQYTHRFNRLSLAGGATVQRLDYEDTDTAGGGTTNNDDRDRIVYRPGLRVSYMFMPNYSAFVRGEGVFTKYDDSTDDNGIDRDSQGFDLTAGVSLDITGLLFGDVFGGYRERYYDDSSFDTFRGGVYGAGLTWIPTRLTTVNLRVLNEVLQTVDVASSSYTSTGVFLKVDHELLRNLILGAGGTFRFDNFDGDDRESSTYGASVSAEYLMNRYIRLGARYRYLARDSNVTGDDFSQNSVMMSLTLTP